MAETTPLHGTLILADEFESGLSVGRPRLYDSPAQLDEAVMWSVQHHAEKKIPLTLTRLVLSIGFSSIQSFINYRAYPEFLESVERARTMVMVSYEDAVLLHKNAPAGRILGAMDAENFNPAIKLEGATEMPHEDRLQHLR